jgi:hypothetical protein
LDPPRGTPGFIVGGCPDSGDFLLLESLFRSHRVGAAMMIKIYALLFALLVDVGHIRGFVQTGSSSMFCTQRRVLFCLQADAAVSFENSLDTARTRLSTTIHRSALAGQDDVALEHRGVPAEHQGLHSALYGDGDDHGVSDDQSNELVQNDVTSPAETFLEMSKGKKVAGVFAILNPSETTTFIGFSRSLHTSISGLEFLVLSSHHNLLPSNTYPH